MARVQFRRDSKANWETYNPILADGEIGIESDTKRFKIGDGTKAWTGLSYSSKALADNPEEYIKSLSIADMTYTSDGTLTSTTYAGGYKALYTYNGDTISKVEYTDVDGVTILATLTYNYVGGNLASITKS